MKTIYTTILLLFIFIFPPLVKAQEIAPDSSANDKITSDRPGFSDGAFLVRKGLIQLETGFNYQHDQSGGIEEKLTAFNSSLIRYGISENIEIRFSWEYLRNQTSESESDKKTVTVGGSAIGIGTKIHITEAKGIVPQTSFICFINLPYFGKKEFRPDFIAPGFRFATYHPITENFSISCNIGSQWDEPDAGAKGLYACNLEYALSDNLCFFAEGYGYLPEKSKASHGFDSGFNYLITDNFQIDISGGVGITENAPDEFISLGFSWGWCRKK